MSQKNCRCLIFYNVKTIELILIILAHYITIVQKHASLSTSHHILSLRFNSHISRQNWVSRFSFKLRMMEVVVITGAISRVKKTPVKSSPPTNQHPTFYRPDVLPVTQPTVSENWRESKHWRPDLLTTANDSHCETSVFYAISADLSC